MTQEKWKNNKGADWPNHDTKSLFTEWPAPSEVVKGFGGSPDKADNKQWKMKKGNSE